VWVRTWMRVRGGVRWRRDWEGVVEADEGD